MVLFFCFDFVKIPDINIDIDNSLTSIQVVINSRSFTGFPPRKSAMFDRLHVVGECVLFVLMLI